MGQSVPWKYGRRAGRTTAALRVTADVEESPGSMGQGGG